MIKFLKGGHYEKKGYHYTFYFNTPSITKQDIKSIKNRKHKHIKISFPTEIYLISNNSYVNIGFSLLGLGFGLELQTRS